jgi:peptidoglycan/LPS O-acetylase OafA/YrhL
MSTDRSPRAYASTEATGAARPAGRIVEVDGLRGIAIFLVLLWHYFAVPAQAPHRSVLSAVLILLRLAWSGVDLFFVLSGFLIGGILLDARDSTGYFATFYRRRFFRIVPLYSIVCILYAIAVHSGGARWGGTVGRWLFNDPIPWYAFPVFLQNVFMAHRGTFDPLALGVTWSLAIEEQFYLTLPFLIRFLPRRRLVYVLVAVALLAPVMRALAFYDLPYGGLVAYVSMPMRADALLAGVFVAMFVRNPRAWAVVAHQRKWIKIAVASLSVAALWATAVNATNTTSAVLTIVGYSALALFYALVLLLTLSAPAGHLSRLLRARWLRALGGIAYGTYLLHIAVLGLCFGMVFRYEPRITNLRELLVTLAALALTVIVAQISWTFFEKRMVRIGQRSTYGEPTRGQHERQPPDRASPAPDGS